MPAYDKLQGMVAQSMGGPKPAVLNTGIADLPQWLPGTYSWTVPQSGFYKFWLWSSGGGGDELGGTGNAGGGSGAYAEKTKYLSRGQVVSIVVAAPGARLADGNPSSITFPDGTTVQCTGGKRGGGVTHDVGGLGGVATGGDVNINGSAGGDLLQNGNAGGGTAGGAGGAVNGNGGGGGGAPANLPMQGGNGGNAGATSSGLSPGGGGGALFAGGTQSVGGVGFCAVQYKGS